MCLRFLGHMDLDHMNDWNTAFVNEETSSRAIHFISNMRKLKTISTNQHAKSYSIDSLGDKQRIAYNVILEHYRTSVDPQRMIIQGTAGTQKSYLIGSIQNTLENLSHPGKSALILLAPTGVAAFNISTRTVHYALYIPIKEINPLRGSSLINIQEDFLNVKYILIDEMSFIGKNLLIKIDSRLRLAFPENANIPFGGRSIILVGDLGKLPHVMDKPIYASEGIAKELWNTFTIVLTLDIVF